MRASFPIVLAVLLLGPAVRPLQANTDPAISGLAPAEPPAPAAPLGERSWNEVTGSALQRLERIEAMGLMPSHSPPNMRLPDLPYVAGYEVVFASRPVAAPEQERIKAVLDQEEWFTPTKAARFLPAVALRLHGGGRPLDLILCPGCSTAGVVEADGEQVRIFDVDGAAMAELLALAKKIFPEDRALQELQP